MGWKDLISRASELFYFSLFWKLPQFSVYNNFTSHYSDTAHTLLLAFLPFWNSRATVIMFEPQIVCMLTLAKENPIRIRFRKTNINCSKGLKFCCSQDQRNACVFFCKENNCRFFVFVKISRTRLIIIKSHASLVVVFLLSGWVSVE